MDDLAVADEYLASVMRKSLINAGVIGRKSELAVEKVRKVLTEMLKEFEGSYVPDAFGQPKVDVRRVWDTLTLRQKSLHRFKYYAWRAFKWLGVEYPADPRSIMLVDIETYSGSLPPGMVSDTVLDVCHRFKLEED